MALSMAYSSPYTASFLHSLPQLSPRSAFSSLSAANSLPRYSVSVHQPISSIPIRCSSSSRADFDPKAGVSVYKPKSYEVLVTDAAISLVYALDNGKTRLEIDFPRDTRPLPSNVSSYKGSSDEFIDANIQLALAVVRKLQERKETKACIVFPDRPEKRRASQIFKTALDSVRT